jgi:hypothetical protein
VIDTLADNAERLFLGWAFIAIASDALDGLDILIKIIS